MPGASLRENTRRLSSHYFSLIPHVFGKNKPPVISAASHIEKEMALLDDLANAVIANNILSSIDRSYVHPFDRELKALHLDEITPCMHTLHFQYPKLTTNSEAQIYGIQTGVTVLSCHTIRARLA